LYDKASVWGGSGQVFFQDTERGGNAGGENTGLTEGAGTGVPACAEYYLLLLLLAVVFVVVSCQRTPTPCFLLFVVSLTSDGRFILVAIFACRRLSFLSSAWPARNPCPAKHMHLHVIVVLTFSSLLLLLLLLFALFVFVVAPL
jgi:hypothetical protein